MMLRIATTNIIAHASQYGGRPRGRARFIFVVSLTSIRTPISCVGIIFHMYLDHFMTLSIAPAAATVERYVLVIRGKAHYIESFGSANSPSRRLVKRKYFEYVFFCTRFLLIPRGKAVIEVSKH